MQQYIPRVSIKRACKPDLPLNIHSTNTIMDLKNFLSNLYETEAENLHIFHGDKELEDYDDNFEFKNGDEFSVFIFEDEDYK